jgi:hypothetical protein
MAMYGPDPDPVPLNSIGISQYCGIWQCDNREGGHRGEHGATAMTMDKGGRNRNKTKRDVRGLSDGLVCRKIEALYRLLSDCSPEDFVNNPDTRV